MPCAAWHRPKMLPMWWPRRSRPPGGGLVTSRRPRPTGCGCFGVARRVVAGRQRSLRRRRDLLARLAASNYQPGATMGPAATTSAGDHVIEALGRLRPGEREALLLVVWDQLSHAEAAVVLGCSANAVAIRVYRAKIRLREQLGISGGTVPHNRAAAPRLAAHALPRDRN